MSKLERLKEKARTLEARDPKGAIDAWLEALKTEEGEGEGDVYIGCPFAWGLTTIRSDDSR